MRLVAEANTSHASAWATKNELQTDAAPLYHDFGSDIVRVWSLNKVLVPPQLHTILTVCATEVPATNALPKPNGRETWIFFNLNLISFP
jgi:hypothetical protein